MESFLRLTEVKEALNITGTGLDPLLQEYIEAAEALVGEKVGPLIPESVTVTVAGGSSGLALPRTPVASLTTITPSGGTALDLNTVTFDARAGVITNTADGAFTPGFYAVTYMSGWDPVPAGLKRATIALLRHLWKAEQRGSGQRRPGAGGGQAADENAPGYLIPYVVAAQLEPYGPGLVFG